MKIVYLTHSLSSCWNHGNAHFLRGVLRALKARGHDVVALEPEDAWSLQNLLADHGDAGLDAYRAAYPDLRCSRYSGIEHAALAVENADLVIVHEWNAPVLVAALGRLRARGAHFTLLFHDTHHRAVSDPEAIRHFALDGYDGVLAFGAALAEIYRGWGWGKRVFVWHEAADITLFQPPVAEHPREGLVWIGNWGDEERSTELESYLLRPTQELGLPLDIFGVRYPAHARAMLDQAGACFHGWLPNARAPQVFARHLFTVHVPRRFYVELLPGIPTIRMFEALACGIALVSAPWQDSEHLFSPGEDFLLARNPAEMKRHMATLATDPALRRSLAAHGLATVQSRHSCAHRADALLAIVARLRSTAEVAAA